MEWEIWRNVLGQGVCDEQCKLHCPLGEWISLSDTMWWHDPSNCSLGHGSAPGKTAQQWMPENPKQRGQSCSCQPTQYSTEITLGRSPAACTILGSDLFFTGSAEHMSTHTSTTQQPNALLDAINNLPLLLRWALEHSLVWQNFNSLIDSFKRGTLIGVTDGSCKNNRGAAH